MKEDGRQRGEEKRDRRDRERERDLPLSCVDNAMPTVCR